jgi:hypothetical protein
VLTAALPGWPLSCDSALKYWRYRDRPIRTVLRRGFPRQLSVALGFAKRSLLWPLGTARAGQRPRTRVNLRRV